MAAEEVCWRSAGAQLAGKRWRGDARRGDARPVLALHGWLDNAGSFDALAPLLHGADVVALDLPGHGHSDHRPLQGTYNIWDDLPDILRTADQLGWEKFHLLGHSRGAIISALLSAAVPERVVSTVMLDALRPPPITVEETFQQLGRFARDYAQAPRKGSGARYESFERALEVRCRVAQMSEQTARPIVERGLEQIEGFWQWRADPRLHLPSAFKLSAQHNRLLLEQLVQRPYLVLLAQDGVGGKMQSSGELDGLGNLRWEMLPGSHHFHLEENAAARIAEKITAFWDGLA
jgi:pimeloyl-ACP methyl ester carboxylesterase